MSQLSPSSIAIDKFSVKEEMVLNESIDSLSRRHFASWLVLVDAAEQFIEIARSVHAPPVVGSMIDLTSETILAGKPPCCACSRTIASLGAMYTQ
jgi:hypothetical protein